MKTIVTLLFTAVLSTAQTVFDTDFNSTLPASIDAGSAQLTGVQGFAGLGPQANPFQGNFLRSPTASTVKIQLTGLPAHTTVNIAFLLAAIDSLDGSGTYPSGDYFHIKVDDVSIFRESLANAVISQIQTYVPAPGALLARRVDLGFTGPGSFYTDSAYNLGLEPRLQNIPHSSSSLKLEVLIEGVGNQSLDDESWAMDNLNISVSNNALPQNPYISNYKVTYPVGQTPYFTGLLNGAQPLSSATLQSSTDLGLADLWQDLANVPVNVNGSASFTDVPDPSASGSPRNFYRIRIVTP
ncbi:MAG: hypothetical protein RIS76_2862 [Verrucomicrobiota bacterium]|jgi:hypothetical protein